MPDGWEEHRRRQIREILLGTTPAQRLAWVEEAIDLAISVGALPPKDRPRRANREL